MATLKHESSKHYIIASGSVSTYKEDPLTIEFDNRTSAQEVRPLEEGNLKLEIHFLLDKEKGQNVKTEIIGDSPTNRYLKIMIYNVHQGFNGGLTEPFLIAQNEQTKKNTYLNLSFHKYSKINTSVLCNYTIFVDK